MLRRLLPLFTLIACLGLPGLPALPARAEPPQRIVSAGGDLSEILVELGLEDRLVGVDTTSTWPPRLTALPQIGYVRRLAPEGILSLDPDLMVAAHDAAPQSALDKLRAAGLPVHLGPATEGAASVPAKMRWLGALLDRQPEAAKLATAFEAEMAEVRQLVASLKDRPRVLFILYVRNGTPLVGGRGSSADAIIQLAGGENAASALQGFKPMNREAMLAAAPDVLLMMTRYVESEGGLDKVLARPDVALTPAGRNRRAVVMDGLLLLGFGPRTPQAVRQLAGRLHPDILALSD